MQNQRVSSKIKRVVTTLLISFLVVSAIYPQQTKEVDDHEKAKIIIKHSQDAIYQGIKRENIKSLYLKTEGVSVAESTLYRADLPQPIERKARQNTAEDVSFEFPDKMNRIVSTFSTNKNSAENYTKVTTLLNADNSSINVEAVRDGRQYNPNESNESQEKVKPTKEAILKGIASRLFPILLDLNWMNDKTFIYIGRADSGDIKADILQVENITDKQIRYYFDEKTHLLLMITEETSQNGKWLKSSTYFDDYQLADGLMIAKKVNIELESSVAETEVQVKAEKVKMSSKSKITTETIIKELKINAAFKPDIFAIKEIK